MAVYVCKRCAGALSYIKGSAACKCEYCGTVQSLPRFDDEQLSVLYERAARYRKNGEYSMALSLYESILIEENSDADLFWSVALCRYGVEFISGTDRPVVNCTRHTAFCDDKDYISALRFALPEQKEIFEREAALIDAVRSENIAISQQEEPYDIYISCLETDETGRRTVDSTLAADIHKLLTNAGYRVFFPRISLAENTCVSYEPYIFAALNSAAVMIVIGTRAEHFSHAWVRNEWERYLALINNGTAKTVFPAVRNVDPYNMPKELSVFQALDMTRLGFAQDLLTAVERLIRPRNNDHISNQQISFSSDDINALLARVHTLLDTKAFSEAYKLCDSMLDLWPENAHIYLAKLLAKLQLTNENELGQLRRDISRIDSYLKAVRFGNEELSSKLVRYKNQAAYSYYTDMLLAANDEEQCNTAEKGFISLGEYLDSSQMAANAVRRAKEISTTKEQQEKERHYKYAIEIMHNDTSEQGLQCASELLRSLDGYKDSESLAAQCDAALAELNHSLVQAREAAEMQLMERQRAHKRRIFRAALISIGAAMIVLTVILIPVAMKKASTNKIYDQAVSALEMGDYDLAEQLFSELGDHADSKELLLLAKYRHAEELVRSESYDKAIAILSELSSYKDSSVQISAVKYRQAMAFREKGDYTMAINKFKELGAYSDSEEQILLTQYSQALQLRDNGDFDQAAAILAALGEYSDANEQYLITKYDKAIALQQSGEYMAAIKEFKELDGYNDSQQRVIESKYCLALALRDDGKYWEAIALLEQLGDHSNAKDILPEIKYDYALLLLENNSYTNAIQIFMELGDYSDSADKVNSSKYDYAVYLREQGDSDSAIEILEELGDYSDSAQLAEEIAQQKAADPHPGDIITFGRYEQDGVLSNGKEPIEWEVLERDGNRVLLISKYCIELMQFDSGGKSVTWENCDLRYWLNNNFLYSAFDTTEQARILNTLVDNQYIHFDGDVSSGNNTFDKVFILSFEEVYTYGRPTTEDKTYATEYVAQRIDPHNNDVVSYYERSMAISWWSRTLTGVVAFPWVVLGGNSGSAEDVNPNRHNGVRPVIWVTVE